MAEGKVEPESAPGTEETGKVIKDLLFLDPMKMGGRGRITYRMPGTPYGGFPESSAGGSIVDATGNPVSIVNVGDIAQTSAQADNVFINLRKEEFERLNLKSTEVLNQTHLHTNE